MKKYLSIFLAALMVATMMAGCGGGNGGSSAPAPSTPASDGGSTSAPAPEGTKVWNVANIVNGNLGDKSFFDSCEAGLKKLQDDGLIKYKTFELGATDADQPKWVSTLDELSADGSYDLIVCGTYQMDAYLNECAAKYPDQKYFIYDAEVAQPNVASITFKQNDLGYLVGTAAALMTSSSMEKINSEKVIGFVGGEDGPVINDFLVGFIQGAQAAASETGANVEVQYSYLYGEGYSASPDLQTQINGWYANGTEVVFACGGSMCNSVFAAAASNNGISIGVDVDQAEESNTVMTSAMKGLSEAASLMLGEYFDGNWDSIGGTSANLGVDDDAVGLPYATSRFEVFTEDAYNALVDGMKSGGSLEVKGDYDAFLAGDETFANVTVNFVK